MRFRFRKNGHQQNVHIFCISVRFFYCVSASLCSIEIKVLFVRNAH